MALALTFSGAALHAQVIPSSFFTETIVQGLTPQCPPTHCARLSPGDAFTITDMQGKMVQRGVANDHGCFRTGDLASGIYLLHFITKAGEPITVKFTK